MNYSAVEITSFNFHDFVMESKHPFLVLFSTNWNVHKEGQLCRSIAEHLESLSDQWIGKMLWGIADITLISPVILSQYRITSIPTIVLFKNGELELRVKGLPDKKEFHKMLSPYLK
jgi:thioredoxin 1